MILYPFQPGLPDGYSIAGFDEAEKKPRGELYLLAPGAQPPADFRRGVLFCAAGGTGARLLRHVREASSDAPAVWCGTQISGGSLETYLRRQLDLWGSRLWVYLAPICMLFPVPCPTGLGRALDAAEAAALQARYPSHFSPDFVCRYSFFLDAAGQARVFLFDTDETCIAKLALLRGLGVHQVFGTFPLPDGAFTKRPTAPRPTEPEADLRPESSCPTPDSLPHRTP